MGLSVAVGEDLREVNGANEAHETFIFPISRVRKFCGLEPRLLHFGGYASNFCGTSRFPLLSRSGVSPHEPRTTLTTIKTSPTESLLSPSGGLGPGFRRLLTYCRFRRVRLDGSLLSRASISTAAPYLSGIGLAPMLNTLYHSVGVRKMKLSKRDRNAFRRAGKIGGETRAKGMTDAEKSESARKAAKARWAKTRAEVKKLEQEDPDWHLKIAAAKRSGKK